ncbi:flavin monooxygenase-like protein [Stachybotrys elegans]|uniref:Flavin monooxygenase-like protein n=1 Tax=Stachybotrys elegans TaxID=80388 RepID=A0A8K0SX76_9HYPO|nr:flavin monooxygenase-like protein [Stachybotrys elegans]
MTAASGQTVAVIGLGAMGLATVKNLLEEGFQVTGFERSAYVGGLWHYTKDPETLSVLESTVVNVSIDRGCYTDFPFPKDTPAHCSAREVQDYLESYADHFNLRPHLRLNTDVKRIWRSDEHAKWQLELAGAASEYFDKVVVATGPHQLPMMPQFEGEELFTGRLMHSRAFKTADAFTGKRVVIVGLGNTGGDIADDLIGHASSISISHNRGAVIMPRERGGVPATNPLSYRFLIIISILDWLLPRLAEVLFNRKAAQVMQGAFGDPDPAWNLRPFPSVRVTNPIISDTLIPNLRSGAIRSVPGIKRFTGPDELELENGDVIQADAVICCTGYKNDFRLVDPRYDPAADPSPAWLNAAGSHDRPLPRLYQNVFSLKAPDSLAYVGCAWFVSGAFCLADIVSMCIAQVWAGKSSLPDHTEMERWVQRQEKRICALAQRGTVIPASVPPRQWLVWADKTAGMGVEEHLGWGWKGWVFWWRDRQLWRMAMNGVLAASIWRLFEGKRKAWDGARDEVLRVNTVQAKGRLGKDL